MYVCFFAGLSTRLLLVRLQPYASGLLETLHQPPLEVSVSDAQHRGIHLDNDRTTTNEYKEAFWTGGER